MEDRARPAPRRSPVWKLAEANARLSDIVRLAAAGQPQRVAVDGREAVVIVAARDFDRLRAQSEAPNLHHLLSQSPLSQMGFEHGPIAGPVREVDIDSPPVGRQRPSERPPGSR